MTGNRHHSGGKITKQPTEWMKVNAVQAPETKTTRSPGQARTQVQNASRWGQMQPPQGFPEEQMQASAGLGGISSPRECKCQSADRRSGSAKVLRDAVQGILQSDQQRLLRWPEGCHTSLPRTCGNASARAHGSEVVQVRECSPGQPSVVLAAG